MSDYLNYLDEVYTDLVAEYGEGITLAYHQANIAEMWGNSHRNTPPKVENVSDNW